MSKRPPELTWQDKAILTAIPLIVFIIFIVANYFTQDNTVLVAFEQKMNEVPVRDGGTILKVYPEVATDTISCRLATLDGTHEFKFTFNRSERDDVVFEPGRQLHFYGEYIFDDEGGTVTAPYRGKSGRMSGWMIYGSQRFAPRDEFDETPL